MNEEDMPRILARVVLPNPNKKKRRYLGSSASTYNKMDLVELNLDYNYSRYSFESDSNKHHKRLKSKGYENMMRRQLEAKVSKMKEIWSHIPNDKLDLLDHLIEQPDILECLYDLFSEEEEETYFPCEPQSLDELGVTYTEDFSIQLEDKNNHALLIRVCSTLEVVDGKYKRKLTLSGFKPLSLMSAWIIEDYDESKHKQFNEQMEELFYNY